MNRHLTLLEFLILGAVRRECKHVAAIRNFLANHGEDVAAGTIHKSMAHLDARGMIIRRSEKPINPQRGEHTRMTAELTNGGKLALVAFISLVDQVAGLEKK